MSHFLNAFQATLRVQKVFFLDFKEKKRDFFRFSRTFCILKQKAHKEHQSKPQTPTLKTNGCCFANHLAVTIQQDLQLTHKQPYTPNINTGGKHCTTFVWASVWVVCFVRVCPPYLRVCVIYWCGSAGENWLLCQHIIVIFSDLRGWDGWAAKR